MFTKGNKLKSIYLQTRKLFFLGFAFLITSPLYAGSTDYLPWDAPGQKIESWLTGSVAKIVAIVLIAISGIMFATGEHGGAFRRMMGVVFGVSIAAGAVTIYASLGFSGVEI